jgi:hypothetical protein
MEAGGGVPEAAADRSLLLEGAVLASTLAAYPIGLLLGAPPVLPFLVAAPAYLGMAALLKSGDRGRAVRLMLLWALLQAVAGTLAFRMWPARAEAVVIHGAAYREEMFHFIRSGEGAEGSLRLFLPQHVAHVATFVALSLATGSVLSIVMGAALMNYMDFYVASLSLHGVPALEVVCFGWQPYAIVRVAAFCTLGAVLAEPVLSRVLRYPYPGLSAARTYVALALCGILTDWIVKATIAPYWGFRLREFLGP